MQRPARKCLPPPRSRMPRLQHARGRPQTEDMQQQQPGAKLPCFLQHQAISHLAPADACHCLAVAAGADLGHVRGEPVLGLRLQPLCRGHVVILLYEDLPLRHGRRGHRRPLPTVAVAPALGALLLMLQCWQEGSEPLSARASEHCNRGDMSSCHAASKAWGLSPCCWKRDSAAERHSVSIWIASMLCFLCCIDRKGSSLREHVTGSF